jgi:chromosome partitioning protein
MKVISIINLKGGVGKTFTTYNMAYELSKRGKKVLLIDNDKQGNLSKALSVYQASGSCGTAQLLNRDWKSISDIIKPTEYPNIDIIAANMSLLTATYSLTYKDDGQQHLRYKSIVAAVGKQYDYCIIDNPPDIALNVVNALAITDQVIVPVKIDEWALEGLEIITDQIDEAKRINKGIKLHGVLVTMYRNTEANIAGMEWLGRNAKIIGCIRYSDKAVDTTFSKQAAYEYSPCSAVAQDYKKFVTKYLLEEGDHGK